MPAAVGALMGTIPEDKAGVGSALNDTVQQAGTALGSAILGSLLSSGFADRMPEGTPDEAKHSIAGAVAAIGVLAAALVMRDDRRKPREGAEGGAGGTPEAGRVPEKQPEPVV